jgi:hypothetical protein
MNRIADEKIPADLFDAVQACRAAMAEAQLVLVEQKRKLGYCLTLYCWGRPVEGKVRCEPHLKRIAASTAKSREKHPRARRRHGQ